MKRTFYEMKHFTKKWNELGFTDDDLRSLQNMLLEDPKAGPPATFEERTMSTMYESLMEGLQEDLKDIQTYGEPQGRKTVIEYIPVKEYTADEVKSIRKGVGVSQSAFAKCLGVSKKTVEKWESGDNIPSGPASRLLDLFFNHTISTSQYIKHV